jgi:hypothetical protein
LAFTRTGAPVANTRQHCRRAGHQSDAPELIAVIDDLRVLYTDPLYRISWEIVAAFIRRVAARVECGGGQ